MAFQISHGLTDCLYGFLCSRVNVAVDKICREAISNVLVLHMMVIELQHVHQLSNLTVSLLPKTNLVTVKIEYSFMGLL